MGTKEIVGAPIFADTISGGHSDVMQPTASGPRRAKNAPNRISETPLSPGAARGIRTPAPQTQ
jgi:hypothetical protein